MKSHLTKFVFGGIAALASLPLLLTAQEQTAPAIPVEQPALEPAAKPEATAEPAKYADANAPIPDYKDQITGGLKERERRLTLLNEAMMKLREAGENEDAMRVEERIRSLLEMPAPSQAHTKLKSEIDQLRAKNDELVIQMMAMEEELKRFRGPGSKTSTGRKTTTTGTSATPLELSSLEPRASR